MYPGRLQNFARDFGTNSWELKKHQAAQVHLSLACGVRGIGISPWHCQLYNAEQLTSLFSIHFLVSEMYMVVRVKLANSFKVLGTMSGS